MSVKGRMCLHPDRPRIVQLMAGYITLTPEKGDVIVLDRIETNEIEPFLESLQFLPLGLAFETGSVVPREVTIARDR
jgi:hypothetical protein